MTQRTDLESYAVLASESKYAVEHDEWCGQIAIDLADAVLALAERVRELERDIGESAIDASAEHARVVAFLEHQADLRVDDKSAWAALKGVAFAIKGREHDKCLKALQASLQARAAAKVIEA